MRTTTSRKIFFSPASSSCHGNVSRATKLSFLRLADRPPHVRVVVVAHTRISSTVVVIRTPGARGYYKSTKRSRRAERPGHLQGRPEVARHISLYTGVGSRASFEKLYRSRISLERRRQGAGGPSSNSYRSEFKPSATSSFGSFFFLWLNDLTKTSARSSVPIEVLQNDRTDGRIKITSGAEVVEWTVRGSSEEKLTDDETAHLISSNYNAGYIFTVMKNEYFSFVNYISTRFQYFSIASCRDDFVRL